jgi:type I restriction enzyme S subunit
MSSDWRTVKLSEVAIEVTVGFVGTMTNEYIDHGIPFLRSLNVDRFKINSRDIRYISRDFHSRISKSRLIPGDVVIVRTGKPGTCGVIPEELPESNCSDLVIVRCGSEILNRFFCYYVNSAASNHIAAHLVGAVQQHFNVASAKTMEIPLPPIQEQKAIAHILGTLDDKIELNRKTNVTLEAMAKALFKSWFVDFDPVRAKAEGRPTGLPAEISDLFPDSFEDSDLGEIPRGWKVKSLDEVAHFLNGLALQKFPPEDGAATLPVIKIAQLKKGDSTGADRCSTAVPSDYVVRDGDMLFSWSGSLAVDIWCGGDGALNQHLFKVTSKTYGKWFFYQWVNHHLPVFQEIAQGKATTMGHIQRRHLSEAKVLIPPPSLLAAMDSAFTALLDRAFGLRRQAKDLGSTRDALLPKLISGELRIPDAEKMLEEVGV